MTELSFKERERRRREHEILLHARRLIRAGGFADLTMDDLAQAVGVSKPTLYQHFRSKDDLTARVVIGYIGELEEQLRAIREVSPLERLKAVLRVMLVQHYGAGSLLTDYEYESIFVPFRSHPEVVAAKKRLMSQISQVVDEGKACGEIVSTTSTPLIGCLLLKMFGLPATLQVLASDSDGLVQPQARSRLVETVVELFARSIADTQQSGIREGS